MADGTNTDPAILIERATQICGTDNVLLEEADRVFYSSDLYRSGDLPSLVAAPGSTDEVAALVKLARETGRAVYVRGGGMSYTDAFLPEEAGAILLDMRRLSTIRSIDPINLYATVESGLTWKALDEALRPHGLRSVFLGPASGATATVGGSMSQGTANAQSGQSETSSNAVMSFEIVTGQGEVLQTGLDGQTGRLPTFRPYGPDLTGLFTADAGALGIKTAVTLKLEPRPAAEGGVSCAFDNFEALRDALRIAAASGLASGTIAMDSITAGIRSGETGLMADLKKLMTIISTAHNPFRGLIRGVKIALAGRRVFETAIYTAHFLAEGSDDAILVAKERALRKLISPYGDEIPSAAISMIRAQFQSFAQLPTTDMAGRRMLPIHGVFSWTRMLDFHSEYTALLGANESRLEEAGVTIADVCTGLGRSALLFEPVFYWHDTLTDFHRRSRPAELDPLEETHPDNPEARALVEELKIEMIDLMRKHGAAHLQIGKLYPFMEDRSEVSASVLQSLKGRLDPDNVINPGALGLTPSGSVK